MRITIANVKFNIPFMFKDPEDIRNELRSMLDVDWVSPKKFQDKFGSANLSFVLVLERKTENLEVKGPTADKELVDFAIWLPYKKINSSNNYRLSYISHIEEGMKKILSMYGFDLEYFNAIFLELKKKEIENG
ncbi:MAG: hypothetical protein KIPDCIKN_01972 [Haliscomenobacter sp.]|jgi:hypothetical protein|nr:hypothetical protein [Haliscomenobacter sp.]